MNAFDGKSRASPLLVFVILTLALSWLPWIPRLVGGQAYEPAWERVALALSTFSPSLVGIALVAMTRNRKGWRAFLCRIIDGKRISLWWYFFILFFPAMIAGLNYGLDALLGGELLQRSAAAQVIQGPIPLFQFILVTFIGGALAQELGWRGFALDRLQSSRSALRSSLILGVIWSLWHLPSWVMGGVFSRGAYGGVNPFFMTWVIGLLAESIVYTWVYNNTNRSLLAVLVLHFMTDATYSLIQGTEPTAQFAYIGMFLKLIVAAAIVWQWGSRELVRYPETVIKEYPGASSPAN